MVIDSVCSQTVENEISSNAKSFPATFVFKLVMQIVADIAAPEFQVVKNSSQSHVVAVAFKFAPTGIPLIVNSSDAGFVGKNRSQPCRK